MADPLSYEKFIRALRDEGLKVEVVGNPPRHNRNHKGPWGPVHGVMIHHTVTTGTQRTVDLCRRGYMTLPGPLCHGVIGKNGVVYIVGYGRANHAGAGDDDVLRAVIAERSLPADNEANTDGNRHFYGFECENLGDGRDPWPAAQLDAIERVSAAICRAHRWNEKSVIGHLEWQPGKVDPRGFTMASMRGRVAKRLGIKPDTGGDSKSATGTYTVQRGDTLWAIALAHGTTVPVLVDLNSLADPSHIEPGQKLKTPAAATTSYEVKRGDTLWSIAADRLGDGRRYREIATLSGVKDADELSPGQKLKIPAK
ncbi:LysM peptidoglycan-binding domain-containing protein [Streptomyces pini]|uniref:LysM repeat-containing protein n=1 Tax=Streptomyces pini TaxID=1520580 RepID=A0A1I4BXB0_9ACTN|nr:LysM peptidoglycan-binding domain-containing protein [Streptomyces pini]SFK72739.1 LysM repeat-containing protein [Streptomyces pini]